MKKYTSIKELAKLNQLCFTTEELCLAHFMVDVEEASMTLDRLEQYLDANKHNGPVSCVRIIHGKPIHYIKLVGFCFEHMVLYRYMDHKFAFKQFDLMKPVMQNEIDNSTLGIIRVQFLYLYESSELFPNHNE